MESKKVQLLSPAGNLEKLKIALDFGADAVYGGVSHFSLRNRSSKEFSIESFKQGIEYAHANGKKVYVTINGFPFNSQIESLKNHIAQMRDLSPDAFIIATPGVVKLAKTIAPNIPIHLSTQANVLNVLDAQVYVDMGVRRIVAAREISLNDCVEIKRALPQLEIEIFVHGSMCFAFSGRCLISALQHGRVPNRGSCANDCRFDYEYYVRDSSDNLVRFSGDEMYVKNPDNGVLMRLLQEEGVGTHIFNAKDLNLSGALHEILSSGAIDALKIEGRTKSSYYAGLTARTYRMAVDDFYARRFGRERLYQYELETLKNRGFTQGYIVHRPFARLDTQNTQSAISDGAYQVCLEVDSSGSFGLCKHTLRAGQWSEIVAPLKYYESGDFGLSFPFNGVESGVDSAVRSLSSKKIPMQILESFKQESALSNGKLRECRNELGQIICIQNRYYLRLFKIISVSAKVIESTCFSGGKDFVLNLDFKDSNLDSMDSLDFVDSKDSMDSMDSGADLDSKDSKTSVDLDSKSVDFKIIDSNNLDSKNVVSKTSVDLNSNNLDSKSVDSKTIVSNNLDSKTMDSKIEQNIESNLDSKTTKIKVTDSITFKNIPYKQLDSIHSGNTNLVLLPFSLPPFSFLRIES